MLYSDVAYNIIISIPALLLVSTGMACTDITLGIVDSNPAKSCDDIFKCNPISIQEMLLSFGKRQ